MSRRITVGDLINKLVALDNSQAAVFIGDADTDVTYNLDGQAPVVQDKDKVDVVYLNGFITSVEDEE